MNIWVCKKCDTKNHDSMKFCQVCHHPRTLADIVGEQRPKQNQPAQFPFPAQPEQQNAQAQIPFPYPVNPQLTGQVPFRTVPQQEQIPFPAAPQFPRDPAKSIYPAALNPFDDINAQTPAETAPQPEPAPQIPQEQIPFPGAPEQPVQQPETQSPMSGQIPFPEAPKPQAFEIPAPPPVQFPFPARPQDEVPFAQAQQQAFEMPEPTPVQFPFPARPQDEIPFPEAPKPQPVKIPEPGQIPPPPPADPQEDIPVSQQRVQAMRPPMREQSVPASAIPDRTGPEPAAPPAFRESDVDKSRKLRIALIAANAACLVLNLIGVIILLVK